MHPKVAVLENVRAARAPMTLLGAEDIHLVAADSTYFLEFHPFCSDSFCMHWANAAKHAGKQSASAHCSTLPLAACQWRPTVEPGLRRGFTYLPRQLRTRLRGVSASTRSFSDSSGRRQVGAENVDQASSVQPPPLSAFETPSIRKQLRKWRAEETRKEEEALSFERKQASAGHAAKDYMRPDLQAKDEEGPDDDSNMDIIMSEFDRMTGEYEASDPGSGLFSPGDIIEMPGSGGGKPALSVFLRHTQQYSVLFSDNGRISASTYSQAHFRSPKQFSDEELAPLLAYLPEDPVLDPSVMTEEYGEVIPRDVSSHVLRRMQAFAEDVDDAFRTYSGPLNDLHALVAHPTQARHMLLSEIACKIVGKPLSEAHALPESLLLAVSYSCVRSGFGFKVANRVYVLTRTLLVESRYSATAVQRATRWIRAYQEEASSRIRGVMASSATRADARPIHSFIRKAAQLVDASRKVRLYDSHGSIVGTSQEYLDNPRAAAPLLNTGFSAHDRDIIHFLALYVSSRSLFYHPRLAGLPAIIVRAVKGHEEFTAMQTEVDADAVHTLLIELGVMQPFNNPDAFDRGLFVYDEKLGQDLDAQQAKIDQGVPVEQAADLEDSMAHMRRHWGNLAVYCIDSASTTEVDDGISIESTTDESGDTWVHSHVVHYSSFVTPQHVIGRCAENRFETVYLSEGKLAMLPNFMSNKFSMDTGVPVMTMSMRLNGEGNLVDHYMSVGHVHNVQRISIDQIDAHFGRSSPRSMPNVLSVGGNPAPDVEQSSQVHSNQSRSVQPIDSYHHEPLQRLLSMAKLLQQRRPGHHLQRIGKRTDVSISNSPRNPSVPAHHPQPMAFSIHTVPSTPSYGLRFPDVSLTINSNFDQDLLYRDVDKDQPSAFIVQEFMIFANIVAGLYAAERDIPMVYSGSILAAEGAEDQLPSMRERLQRMLKGQEPVERGFISYSRGLFGLKKLSSRPIKQIPMDLPVYVKATSPLRRHLDLVNHWQFDAALKWEHENGRSLKNKQMDPGWYGDLSKATLPSAPASGDPTALVDDVRPVQPPFSHDDIDMMIAKSEEMDKSHIRFAYSHDKFFVIQAFGRALYLSPERIKPYYPEGQQRPGPDVLNPAEGKFVAILGKTGSSRRTMRLEGLEVAADSDDALGIEDGVRPSEGERWAVKVVRVRFGQKRVVVRLLRRLEDL